VLKRLLSPEGRTRRIALLDNLKTTRFSWADLEGWVTADALSGRQMYAGEGRRPNRLLWVLTINGASLSKDMAQRCVPLRLTRPAYSGSWESETAGMIDRERWAVVGDIIDTLRRPASFAVPAGGGRWSVWEREVLARCCRDAEEFRSVTAEIARRQGDVDDDAAESGLIRDAFRAALHGRGVCPVTGVAHIDADVAVEWLCEAMKERYTMKSGVPVLKGAGIPELQHKRASARNLFVWTGAAAPANAKPAVVSNRRTPDPAPTAQ
jgi:hypothetical protein